MARNAPWRRQVSDAVSWHQDEALNSTIYILRDMGPTGFLLKEDGEPKKFKVFLGDPHSCTCPMFLKERDLCKHICWVLLRKFRVPRQNQVTWQLGLVEREINEILRGVAAKQEVMPSPAARRYANAIPTGEEAAEDDQSGALKQRQISEGDVCPICQEEFLAKHLPVTFCKFGCGNSIHIKCMKVWADHQKSQGETTIKCPLCREDFGPLTLLNEEVRNSSLRQTKAERLCQHLGATCNSCRMAPVTGKCYKCVVCAEYYLCQNCFITPVHGNHSFQFREKPNQRWRPAERGTGTLLPQAMVSAMMSRELRDEDYDTLLQLDSQAAVDPSDLSEETVRSFPTEKVRHNSALLAPGQQCLVCLQRYSEGQFLRRLPCRHKFHRDCIDNWLLHQHATCPVDGTVYTNDSVRAFRQAEKARQQQQRSTGQTVVQPVSTSSDIQLEIPGVGLASLPRLGTTSTGSLRSGHVAGSQRSGSSLPDVSNITISGNRLATGQTSEGPVASGETPVTVTTSSSSARQFDTRVPVAPSIPRPHDANISFGIGRQGSDASPTGDRPPSGRNHEPGTNTRRSARAQTRRPPPNQVHRNRSNSRTRTRNSSGGQSREEELYVGHENAPTMTAEMIQTREQSGSGQRRRNSLNTTSEVNYHAPSHNRDLCIGGEPGLHSNHSNRNPRTQEGARHISINSNSRRRNSTDTSDTLDLFVGSGLESPPGGVLQGPSGRLRQGQVSLGHESHQLHASNTRKPSLSSASDTPVVISDNSSSRTGAALYIGADPSSTESCLRNLLLNSIAHRNRKKTSAQQKAKEQHKTKAGKNPHWGEVREMSGNSNDITLSGSAVTRAVTDDDHAFM